MIRSVTAAIVTVAVVAPPLEMAQAAGLGREASNAEGVNANAKVAAIIEREHKMWGRLSASICSGCITAANRVAPISFVRPGDKPVAEDRIETVKVAVHKAGSPRRFVQLRKRFAKLHRRERLRLASRARLRAALARRHAMRLAALKRRHHATVVRATFVPAYDVGSVNTVYRIPTDQPFTPRDDGRWHETILPTATRMRRS